MVESGSGPPAVTTASRARMRVSLWWGIALVLAAFAAAHGPRLLRNLPKHHWEDFRHFRHNREQIHSLADCFRKPSAWAGGAEATYRPLSANLYYFAGRTLFENRPEAYHALDAGTYLLNALLLLLICRELLPGLVALLPPLLFVSRVAHEQDIAYTSNFDTLSYVALTLTALLLFVRARRHERRLGEALAVAAFAVALLCKEAAIMWPALVSLYGWLFDRARAWRKYLAAWAVAAAWALAYPRILQALYPSDQPRFLLDFSPAGILARYAAYLATFANGLVPRVDPEAAGWAMPPQVATLAGRAPAIALMAALVAFEMILLVLARWRPASVGEPARVTAFGLGWFFVATSPFVVFADRLFMRYCYMGHAGLALAVGGIAMGAWQSWHARARTEPPVTASPRPVSATS
jgi:hypothetical protein